jgi:fucose 4-O-acetylase-like acetyltransferase
VSTGVALRSGAQLARATPESRDRFLDLVRAASIVLVVLGHYTIAGVVRDGSLQGTNALSSSPWLRGATWVFQVMPLFFFVGGATNAYALTRPTARTAGFLRRRVDRLAPPAIVFVAAWTVAAAIAWAAGANRGTVQEGARIAVQPLWFLAVYLLVIAAAPVQLHVHQRRRWALLVTLPLMVAVVDGLRLSGATTGVADVNYLLVFLFAQELGFWYADGALARLRPRRALGVATAAVALLAVLTTASPYPVSMVGVPGEKVSNMSPPTLCIVLLTVAQTMALLAVRSGLTRWLRSARVWRVVVVANGGLLTVFLWHLTAFVIVAAGFAGAGMPLPAAGSRSWWLAKPLWLASTVVVLGVLVALALPVERKALFARPRAGDGGAAPAYVAVLTVAAGLAVIAATGLTELTEAHGRHLLGVRASPLAGVVLLVGGYLLGRWPAHRGRNGDIRSSRTT